MNKDASVRHQLTPISASQKVRMDCMMAELIDNTDWIESNYYMWQEKIIIEIFPSGDRIHLASLESSVERGKGHASRALDWLLELAAKHGVTVSSTIQKVCEGGLNDAQLRCWYVRHGFSVLNDQELLYTPPSSGR